ncbi:MAG: N-acetylmuramoyl-L-alanine amidase [Planctomycetes bacterium]|nr:N-acetylmuramoyl-L-alanine amidase [Planctomycetota bacterium]
MICATLALFATTCLQGTPSQGPLIRRSTWSGDQLARMVPEAFWDRAHHAGADLLLQPGQVLRLRLPTPFPCRSAGIWWEGTVGGWRASWEAGEDTLVPLPVASDLAPELHGARGPAAAAKVSGLLHSYRGIRDVIYLEITGPAVLSSLSLVTIAIGPGGAPHPPPQPALLPSGSSPSAGYPKPGVESRSTWAADPPACNPGYCTVTHLAVHHTAGANEFLSPGYAQCAANVKAIQSYHMYSRGWCDIGYQYLVCVHGRIWEGRAGGDDVIGAHDSHNCGSMATAFMGYFHSPYSQRPNSAMLGAMAELGAWKCDQRGVDPLGSSWYAGFGGLMDNLYGHRDVGSTSCPGDLLFAELPGLRAAIDGLLSGGGWTLVLDNPQANFSGNWTTGTSSIDKYGPDYRWASTGATPSRAWWTPSLPQAGRYEISMWWPAGSNRNPDARVGLLLNGRLHSTTVDQRIQGGRWNLLGTAWLPAGSGTPIGLSNEGPTGTVVIADAIRLIRR